MNAKKIAWLGVMSALLFVMLMLETYAFVLILNPSPAFFSIPLAISISLIGSKKDMFSGGTIFGVCSFILSFIIGVPAFNNPLISILPRVFIGVTAYGIYMLMKRINPSKCNEVVWDKISLGVAGAIGVITNTVLTLTMLSVFDYSGIKEILATILSVNFLIEFICGIIFVPLFVTIIKKVSKVK